MSFHSALACIVAPAQETASKRGVIPSRRRGISAVRALRSLASLGMTRFVIAAKARTQVLLTRSKLDLGLRLGDVGR